VVSIGAIERNGYVFEPEFSIISQNGAVHVYHNGQFLEEIKFNFTGEYPEHAKIEEMVDNYCEENDI
jgi:hypothetical protein